MQIQIIRIEACDDVASVRDKIEAGGATCILLAWPLQPVAFGTQLDLTLLNRYFQAHNLQMAICCRSFEVRTLARELGIPTFTHLGTATKKPWLSPAPAARPVVRLHPQPANLRASRPDRPADPARQKSVWLRLPVFGLGLAAFFALIGLALPGATIDLRPATTQQDITLDLVAGGGMDGQQVVPVPLRQASLAIEGTKAIQTTGELIIPDNPASGVARFTNLTGEAAELPAGTVLSGGGGGLIKFVTTGTAQLAAGAGETVDIPIQAVMPGADGNLPAGAINGIEGGGPGKIAVSNPDPTKGGLEHTVPAPSSTDFSALRENLLDEFRQNAPRQLQDALGKDVFVLPDAITLRQILAEEFSLGPGEPGNRLELHLKAEYVGQIISQADVNRAALMALQAGLPTGYYPVSGIPEVTGLTTPALGPDGKARWRIRATREIRFNAPPANVIGGSLGLPAGQAAGRLQSLFNLASPPVVSIEPRWWPWMPSIPARIAVIE